MNRSRSTAKVREWDALFQREDITQIARSFRPEDYQILEDPTQGSTFDFFTMALMYQPRNVPLFRRLIRQIAPKTIPLALFYKNLSTMIASVRILQLIWAHTSPIPDPTKTLHTILERPENGNVAIDNVPIIQWILDQGAQVEFYTIVRALMSRCSRGVIRLLLQKNPTVLRNASVVPNPFFKDILDVAVRFGHSYATIKLLIDHGARTKLSHDVLSMVAHRYPDAEATQISKAILGTHKKEEKQQMIMHSRMFESPLVIAATTNKPSLLQYYAKTAASHKTPNLS